MNQRHFFACACLGFGLLVNCQTAGAGPLITNWYHVEAWRFPDQPQDPLDPTSLPTDPADIIYNESVFSEETLNPVDLRVGGDTPRSGSAGTSRHEIHVLANSDFTHLRAAFETTLSNFQASNLRPGYYVDSDGNVQADYGDWSGQTFVATFIDELFTLSGPAAGQSSLTYVLNLSGSNSTNVSITGAGAGTLEPWTGGIISAYGAELYGPYIELPKNATVAQSTSLTVQLNTNAPTFTRLAMKLGNDLMAYTSFLSDEQAAQTFLDGGIYWNYESTATIEKLIVTLPAGANPLDYTFTAESGTDYNVEFQVRQAHPVPEPSTFGLLLFGLAGVVGYRRCSA